MKKLLLSVLCVGWMCPLLSGQNQTHTDPEIIEVKKVIDLFAAFWESHDMAVFSSIMAHDHDMVNYGSDASEYFVGWEALKNAVTEMLPAMQNTKIEVRNQVIKMSNDKKIAWFSEIWDWQLTMYGTPLSIPGQRLTGVLEMRNDKWVIVQFHNSVPMG